MAQLFMFYSLQLHLFKSIKLQSRTSQDTAQRIQKNTYIKSEPLTIPIMQIEAVYTKYNQIVCNIFW